LGKIAEEVLKEADKLIVRNPIDPVYLPIGWIAVPNVKDLLHKVEQLTEQACSPTNNQSA